MSSFSIKADTVGAAASLLCMVHCLATPFLFVAQVCSKTCCAEAPHWWRTIDLIFLVISAAAVFQTMKTSTHRWVWMALWASWLVLAASVSFESLAPALFSHWAKYSAATALIGLHFYNMKFCKCSTPDCTIHHG